MILCFDMDGTITKRKSVIDDKMRDKLQELLDNGQRIWVVTGSTSDRCREQLSSLFFAFERVFCCHANEVWEHGTLVKTVEWSPDINLIFALYSYLDDCSFKKEGKHLEVRSGMVTFSFTGCNASIDTVEEFEQFDLNTDYRYKVVQHLKNKFPTLSFIIAGKTSIDIMPEDVGKQEIMLYRDDEIWFFGDETHTGGNDYMLSRAVLNDGGRVYIVSNWEDTYKFLEEIPIGW